MILPVFLYQRGVSLPNIGWIVGVYGFVWGGSQLFTGRLSDHVGRHWPNVLGMWICGGGVALFLLGDGLLWWSIAAGVAGFGMALLYPNLSAAVADISPPAWRGSAIGIYRFWRDLGYAVGGLGLGLAAQLAGGARCRLLVRRALDARLRRTASLVGRGDAPEAEPRRDLIAFLNPGA